jgi:hypothetical protein
MFNKFNGCLGRHALLQHRENARNVLVHGEVVGVDELFDQGVGEAIAFVLKASL